MKKIYIITDKYSKGDIYQKSFISKINAEKLLSHLLNDHEDFNAEIIEIEINDLPNKIWSKDDIINQLGQFETIDEFKRWFDQHG